MNIATVHVHNHIITHVHHQMPARVDCHIVGNSVGKVAVVIVKKCLPIDMPP